MKHGEETGADFTKSKISDTLIEKIRREALKIDFGKIVLNISPKHITVEYTRQELVPR
jgi:hypothetical protein